MLISPITWTIVAAAAIFWSDLMLSAAEAAQVRWVSFAVVGVTLWYRLARDKPGKP